MSGTVVLCVCDISRKFTKCVKICLTFIVFHICDSCCYGVRSQS